MERNKKVPQQKERKEGTENQREIYNKKVYS